MLHLLYMCKIFFDISLICDRYLSNKKLTPSENLEVVSAVCHVECCLFALKLQVSQRNMNAVDLLLFVCTEVASFTT